MFWSAARVTACEGIDSKSIPKFKTALEVTKAIFVYLSIFNPLINYLIYHSIIQSYSDYSDFIQTLSETERENFLEFGKKKASLLPNPPQLPVKWIEAHFEDLRSQWENTSAVQRARAEFSNHPRRDEWLDKIRTLGFGAFIFESGVRDPERSSFFEWADTNNLIWGQEA